MRLLLLPLLAACGVDPGPTYEGEALDDPQLPPRGDAAIGPWLEAGYYLDWACEPERHGAGPRGAHRDNRICTNAVLAAAEGGPFPVGSVSVKELYDGSSIRGFAVGRKLDEGWYWYERDGSTLYADSTGAGLCADCHEDAPEDNVFVRLRD